MTWTKLPDTWSERVDLLKVSRDARLLHVEALIWCNSQTTDGALPTALLKRITDADDPAALAKELEAQGLWTPTPDGWDIDWRDQLSAEEVEVRRELATARQRRSRKHKIGDHSECLSSYCRDASVTRGQTRESTHGQTPTRTEPDRPQGRGGRGEPRGGSAGAPPASAAQAERWEKGSIYGVNWVNAHQYVAGPDGRCAAADLQVVGGGDVRYACEEEPGSWRHAHAFTRTAGAPGQCDSCSLDQVHPVHTNPRQGSFS